MENIFLINLTNNKSFDLGQVDALIVRSAVELPDEFCDDELGTAEADNSFCQNMGECKRDVDEVVDYVVLNVIKQIITDNHPHIKADDITMQTTNSDLELDSFDSLELLAHVEMLFDENIFNVNMKKTSFTMADIVMGVKKILT